ncbi:ZIP family metal transporter [Candidatus Peribacteria bacterium]|nr:ZIP family metal transporter [Candidatus Peribacteria bacterium]
MLVSWIAIFIHTIFDGLGIRAGFSLNRDVGMSILAGVAIHQIPVSLSVASMLRESQFSKNIQIALIIIFAGAAPLGFLLTGNLVEHISTSFVSLATAFAG